MLTTLAWAWPELRRVSDQRKETRWQHFNDSNSLVLSEDSDEFERYRPDGVVGQAEWAGGWRAALCFSLGSDSRGEIGVLAEAEKTDSTICGIVDYRRSMGGS